MLLKQYPSSLINRLEAEISPNEIIRSDENSNEVTELQYYFLVFQFVVLVF